MSESDEFISVHEIDSTKQNQNSENGIAVYQVQGLNQMPKALIIKVGFLENIHDVLINDFKFLKKYKCYIVSRLYVKEELLKNQNIFQMIKIIICKDGDSMNMPLCYLCFNFGAAWLSNLPLLDLSSPKLYH